MKNKNYYLKIASIAIIFTLLNCPVKASSPMSWYNAWTGVYVSDNNATHFNGGFLDGQSVETAGYLAIGSTREGSALYNLYLDPVEGSINWYRWNTSNTLDFVSKNTNTLLTGGTLAGQSIVDLFNNNQILGVTRFAGGTTSHRMMIYNPGSGGYLSYAWSSSNYINSYDALTDFSGGPLNGLTLEDAMNQKLIIGMSSHETADAHYFHLLDTATGFPSIYRWNDNTGPFVQTHSWSTFSGGVLDGMTLEDAHNNGLIYGINRGTGDAYIMVVPEPTSALLSLIGIGCILLRRTRKSKSTVTKQ